MYLEQCMYRQKKQKKLIDFIYSEFECSSDDDDDDHDDDSTNF